MLWMTGFGEKGGVPFPCGSGLKYKHCHGLAGW
ncbi:MAG: hypothetical protein GXP34_02070 [Actinobacteria bacterium]|nr:hypothetical protein [Actinomycetota bacterium]